jgi:hypothetical protein
MLFGSPLPGTFQNNGSTPVPTTRDCVVGERCHILQTITAVFNVPGASAGSYSYDFAYAQLYFDMITTDPVQSVTYSDQSPGVFATGTFTGVLEYFNCGPGADCPFYNDFLLKGNSTCIAGGSCPPILLQTYSLSGVAQGFTDTFNPRANVNFSFTGTAVLTPEPSSIILLGTGLLGAGATVRKKLRKRLNS